jgi:hypothetical protein
MTEPIAAAITIGLRYVISIKKVPLFGCRRSMSLPLKKIPAVSTAKIIRIISSRLKPFRWASKPAMRPAAAASAEPSDAAIFFTGKREGS